MLDIEIIKGANSIVYYYLRVLQMYTIILQINN